MDDAMKADARAWVQAVIDDETRDIHGQLIDYVEMATQETLSAVDRLVAAMVGLIVWLVALTVVVVGFLLWRA